MWLWIISAIASSILGSAADSWFADTKLGIWFYKKVDNVCSWTSRKLHIKILNEEDKWRKKYPRITQDLDDYELRISNLEKLVEHYKRNK